VSDAKSGCCASKAKATCSSGTKVDG
jgi:hypothetical protein